MGLDKADLFYAELLLFGALALLVYLIVEGINKRNWFTRLLTLTILIGTIVVGYMWFRVFMQVIWGT